jgi:iron complex outermembrane recepter protein
VESRWGAAPSDHIAYRIWGKLDYRTPAYGSPGDYDFAVFSYRDKSIRDLDTASGRMGFRVDGQASEKDQWMVQGDLYKTKREDPVAYPTVQPNAQRMEAETNFNGGYLQAHWTHTSAGGAESEVQFSYDRNQLGYPYLLANMQNLTFDFQQRRKTGEQNEIYWGAGFQQYWDDTASTRFVAFNPSASVFRSGDLVLRDEWQALPGLLTLSAGMRVDYNSYRKLEYQPSVRVILSPKANQSAWLAFSRAVRTPNRVDRDVAFDLGTNMSAGIPAPIVNHGSTAMQSEIARSAEAGYRIQSGQRWSVDTSLFWSWYERLRSVDQGQPQLGFTASGPFLQIPLHMGNSGAGVSYGGEISATFQVVRGWRLLPSYSYAKDDRWLPASTPAASYQWDYLPADMRHQGAFRSQHDLSRTWQLDVGVRARSRDNTYALPGVLLVDTRLNWRPLRGTQISFSLHNLTNRQVFETVSEGATPAIPIRRTFVAQWTQRF